MVDPSGRRLRSHKRADPSPGDDPIAPGATDLLSAAAASSLSAAAASSSLSAAAAASHQRSGLPSSRMQAPVVTTGGETRTDRVGTSPTAGDSTDLDNTTVVYVRRRGRVLGTTALPSAVSSLPAATRGDEHRDPISMSSVAAVTETAKGKKAQVHDKDIAGLEDADIAGLVSAKRRVLSALGLPSTAASLFAAAAAHYQRRRLRSSGLEVPIAATRGDEHTDPISTSSTAAVTQSADGKERKVTDGGSTDLEDARVMCTDTEEFVRVFYETFNSEINILYKFYDDEADLTWTLHRKEFSSEVTTKKEIKKFFSVPLSHSTRWEPHCFLTQRRKGDVIAVVVNGNCRGFGRQSSNFVQTFLLTKNLTILSDILLVFKDAKPIRWQESILRPEVQALPGNSEFTDSVHHDGETEDVKSRKRVDGKSVAIIYDERMLLHEPVYFCEGSDARMVERKGPHGAIELPARISSIMKKLYDDGLMERAARVEPDFANIVDILAVHKTDYVGFVQCLPPSQNDVENYIGYNTPDIVLFKGYPRRHLFSCRWRHQGC